MTEVSLKSGIGQVRVKWGLSKGKVFVGQGGSAGFRWGHVEVQYKVKLILFYSPEGDKAWTGFSQSPLLMYFG